MSTAFHAHLVNSPFADPALYVRFPHRGEAVLFDCGELHNLGTRELLKLSAVFISHTHIDHVIGLDHLIRTFLPQKKILQLVGPPGFITQLSARLGGYTWNLTRNYPLELVATEWGDGSFPRAAFRAQEAFRPRKLPPGGGEWIYRTARFCVRALALEHRDILSLAFRLEEPRQIGINKAALLHQGYESGAWLGELKARLEAGEKNTSLEIPRSDGSTCMKGVAELEGELVLYRPGRSLAYVTDASPTPENQARILELASGVDLLAIEATFPHAQLEHAKRRHHLTARMAGELARRCRASRILCFHHSAKYLSEENILLSEAFNAFKTT